MDRMITGYRDRDVNTIMSTYAEQAAYAATPGQPTVGHAALAELFNQIVASNPSFQFKAEEIIIVGKLALHVSAYDAKMLGDEHVHTGLSIAVLGQQKDGEWLMVIDHPSGQRVIDA